MYVIMNEEFNRVLIQKSPLSLLSGKDKFTERPVLFSYSKALLYKVLYWDCKIVPYLLYKKLSEASKINGKLVLEDYDHLKSVPCMTKLNDLRIISLKKLEQIDDMAELERLEIRDAPILEKVGHMPKLKKLRLMDCARLKNLPSLKNVENVFVNCPACDTKINIGENHKKFYKHNERAKA